MSINQLSNILQDSFQMENELCSITDCSKQKLRIEKILKQAADSNGKIFVAGSEASRLLLIANKIIGYDIFSAYDYIAPPIDIRYGTQFTIVCAESGEKRTFYSMDDFRSGYGGDFSKMDQIIFYVPRQSLRNAELVFSVLTEKNAEERLMDYASLCDAHILVVGAQANVQNAERKYISWIRDNFGSTSGLMGVINDADMVDTTVFVRQNLEEFFQEEYFSILECVPEAPAGDERNIEQGFLHTVTELMVYSQSRKQENASAALEHVLIETRQLLEGYISEISFEEAKVNDKIKEFERSWNIFEANCNINRSRMGFLVTDAMKQRMYQDIEEFIACIQDNLESEITAMEDKYQLMYFVEDYLQYLMSEFIADETEKLKKEIYDKFRELSGEVKIAYEKGFDKDIPEEIEKLLDFDPDKLLSTDMVYAGEFENNAKLLAGITVNIAIGILKGILSYNYIFVGRKAWKFVSDLLNNIMNNVVDFLSTRAYIIKTVKKNMNKVLDEQALSMKQVYSETVIPMINSEMQNAHLKYIEQINQIILGEKEELKMSLSQKQDEIVKGRGYLSKTDQLLGCL